MARFRHEDGLELLIRPKYKASTSRKRGKAQLPASYLVLTRQDWFSKGLSGDQEFSTQVDDRSEAMRLASKFMQEYGRELDHIEEERGDEMDDVNSDEAQFELNTEAAAEALTDAAGYTDELLVSTLQDLVGDHLKYVVHRNSEETETAHTREDVEVSRNQVIQLIGLVSADKEAVDTVSGAPEFLVTTVETSSSRLVLFSWKSGLTTVVSIDRNAPVTSPSFEHTVSAVLEEKYGQESGKQEN